MQKSTSALLLLIVFSLPVNGKDGQHKSIKILPVPALGYTPETRTYIGEVSLFTLDFNNDSLTRTSNAKVELNYTWNKQIIAETEWTYFFKQEKWLSKGRLHISKFPDRYYGIGSYTNDSNEQLYQSNRIIMEGSILKKIQPHLFTGPLIKYISYRNVSKSALFPELADNSSLGIGYTLLYDSRKNLLNPTQGWYANITGGYSFRQLQYSELLLDTRYYHTWRNRLTIGLRWYNEMNFSTPPFYDYALLGGDKLVRGYYYGRFRDKNLSTFQTEVRSIIVWRLGLAIFGGISNLYQGISNIYMPAIKYNYGLGLRFLIDRKENINLRVDYARGQDNSSGFYISFGESF